ncbi:hypothetical protein [Paraburkholderia tagetis]|uniref:GGDEF domain-containing protein n=1 Tax=Paraburkholderia tagetis TaxID=2913261 RepID=A0A9X1UP17_9BURK|nr:hypothetical protein [Paraburkholderia tagetis]MCG5078511.1 hypothetical protein [Paraburkholderia tagetis]
MTQAPPAIAPGKRGEDNALSANVRHSGASGFEIQPVERERDAICGSSPATISIPEFHFPALIDNDDFDAAAFEISADPTASIVLPVQQNLDADVGDKRHRLGGESFEFLMNRADAALYGAKKAGKGTYHFATMDAGETVVTDAGTSLSKRYQ